nr:proline-rich protein HaeIII subfamily 1-like [Ovis aries]
MDAGTRPSVAVFLRALPWLQSHLWRSGAEDAFAAALQAALGLTDQRPGGQAGCRMGRRAGAGTVWFQNRRARHPQQSPARGAAATTPPAPEDRRTPPAVQSTSLPPPLPPQESMPPRRPQLLRLGPAFWVPGTAWGLCGQPLIFMVQPSPGALWPSGKPPPPAQVAGPWAVSSPAGTASRAAWARPILPPAQPEAHIPAGRGHPYGEGAAPPLEPQPQPRSLPSPARPPRQALGGRRPPRRGLPEGRCRPRVDPALPGAPSLSSGLLVAAAASPGPSRGLRPGWTLSLPGAPSLLASSWRPWRPPPGPSRGPLPSRCNRQLSLAQPPRAVSATGIHATPGPS